MTPLLRVAWFVDEALTDGPGVRTTVAVQGCSIRCAGCQVPQTWTPQGGTLLDVAAVAERLIATARPISILGGEPLDQAPAVAALMRLLKAEERHVIVYTGYVFEDLVLRTKREPAVQSILAAADIVVDGPFRAELDDDLLQYRGSRNQRPVDMEHWRETGEVRALPAWDELTLKFLPGGAIVAPAGFMLVGDAVGMPGSAARRCGDVPQAGEV